MAEWIKAEEKKPVPFRPVVAAGEYGGYFVCFWNGKNFHAVGTSQGRKPIAWTYFEECPRDLRRVSHAERYM